MNKIYSFSQAGFFSKKHYNKLLMKKFTIILIFVLQLCAANIFAEDSSSPDFSKGPLFGKNLYIPFLIHYNFPSLPAKSGEQFELQYHLSLYYVQDDRTRTDLLPPGYGGPRQYDKTLVVRDYEGCVIETGVAYNILKEVQAGIDMRLFFYYGGFLDPVLESFHNFFGFSGGSREYFKQNQVYVNIPNDNGVKLYLDKKTVSIGDIDLWGRWTFLENRKLSLAALAALKLPTGDLQSLSGSGYPDAAAGLLLDFRAARFISLYTQAGIVVPFNGKSYPMFNGLLGVEFHPWKFLSFNVQMNIKTSPLSDSVVPFGWNEEWGTNFNQLSLPQTNVLGGVVIRINKIRLQLYFEEDAIFNQGNDITFGLMFLHTIKIKKH